MKGNENSQERKRDSVLEHRKKLKPMRDYVLEEFPMIEWLINVIISNHYLAKNNYDFMIQVLQDSFFTFGLKLRILEKILRTKGWYDDKIFQKFRKLGNARNLFAHIGPPLFNKKRGGPHYPHPDPKKIGQNINYEELYENFKKDSSEALDCLLDIFKKIRISDKKK